jgi:hypothetical protein
MFDYIIKFSEYKLKSNLFYNKLNYFLICMIVYYIYHFAIINTHHGYLKASRYRG